VEGSGEWLNTSIYTFYPDPGFAAATEYTVTVDSSLAVAASGATLEDDFSWTFATSVPVVTYQVPTGQDVEPSASITVTFSQPMDRASTETAFALRPDLDDSPDFTSKIPGEFTWFDDDRSFGYQPDEWLDYGGQYHVLLADTARPAVGEGGLRRSELWDFHVVKLPSVLVSDPADGATDVDPYGGMEVYFSAPLDQDTLEDAVTVVPEQEDFYTYYNRWDSRLWISWDREPQTEYTVILDGSIGDPYGNTIGEDVQITFTTGDFPPTAYLDVTGDMGTYNTYADTQISATYRNVSRLDFKLFAVDEDVFMLLTGDQGWRYSRDFAPAEDTLVRQWSVETTAEPNTSGKLITSLLDEDEQPLSTGIYYLTMTAPEVVYEKYRRAPRATLILSRFNLMLKSTTSEALLWATDLNSGLPVPDLPVRLRDEDGLTIVSATDEEGLLQSDFNSRDPWRPLYAFVGEAGTDNYGVVMSRWNEGVSAWDFGLRSETYREPYSGYFFTDRPIYRPGQTVYWKGIIRTADDVQYRVPRVGEEVTIVIRDDMGTELHQGEHALSDMGTIDGALELSENAGLGNYWLEAVLFEQHFGVSFQVAEYRKPEYELSVTTDSPDYIHGDEIEASVSANYFFGGPVREANVRWAVLSRDWFFDWQGDDWYNFRDWDWGDWRIRDDWTRYGELLSEGEGQTDEDGKFSFDFAADISEYKQSQLFTIDVTITDVNGQEVSGSAAAVVHKGEFYIGVSPQRQVGSAGDPQIADLITVDQDSEPVPGVELTVVAASYKWYSVQEEGDDGRFYWTSKAEITPVFTDTLTTNEKGKAIFVWTPTKAGEYKVIASGEDERGNEVRSSAFVWISGRDYVSWRRENTDRIDLIADKKDYAPGDVAKILVPHPFQGKVEALLTVERGHIYDVQRLTLTGNSETIDVPIAADHIPNVFVSVMIVKGMGDDEPLGAFRVGYVELPVSAAEKELDITLSPSADRVGPRDTVDYEVLALDSAGQPVQAELALAVVDKAVLTLAQSRVGAMLDHFYRERGLGVGTAATMVTNLDRVVEEAMKDSAVGAKGGGGGGGPGADPTVRREFPDIAFWDAIVRTDEDGRAQVSVTLPDNLTTWRMLGKGVTAATQVGEAQVDVVATKDLLVRPVAPRFFVVGDHADLSAIVHNNSDMDEEVEIYLEAAGLEIKGSSMHQATVPAGGLVKVSWPVSVLPGDKVTLLWAALGEHHDDAVELALPVYRYSTPEVVGTAGEVAAGDSQLEVVRLPEMLDPTQGDLTVTVAPSLAASMVDGLDYLEHYPWECVEQTLSRFLPNLLTYRALQDLGIEKPDLEPKVGQLVGVGLQRLYNQQKLDGGWGWWSTDASRPFISAYVLFGLYHADAAGFLVDDEVMDQAILYLLRQMEDPDDLQEWELNQQAFMLYVLAEVGEPDIGRTVALYDYRERLDHYGKAYLAMALGLIDEDNERSHIDTLLGDLVGDAILSATGAHWEEETTDWWMMSTDTRSTAVILDAFSRLAPDEPLAPNIVRWLMVARKAGRWETTQETAWALIALTDWMVASGELKGDYSWQVLLNDEVLGENTVSRENVDKSTDLVAHITDLLLDEANALQLLRLPPTGSQSGDGRLYYTAHLRYFLPVEELQPADRGIVVARRYEKAECGGDCDAVSQARVGDVIRVTLTLVAPNDLHYMVLEDPLPAGCEAIDISLKTTSALYEGPELEEADDEDEGYRWWWSRWLPTHSELRDEKVGLFSTWLPAGTYEYTYQMRASLPGRYLMLPSTASEMYFPEIWGRSGGGVFTIIE